VTADDDTGSGGLEERGEEEPLGAPTLKAPVSARTSGGGAPWPRGPWPILIALVGIAAIAAGAYEIAASSKGGSSSSTSRPPALSKAAFIHTADAICARLNPVVEANYRTALADESNGDFAGARRAIARLEAAAGRLIDGITALGPPAEGADTVTALLSEYTQLVNDAVANTAESNAAAATLQTQIASQAAQFGFRVCGVT